MRRPGAAAAVRLWVWLVGVALVWYWWRPINMDVTPTNTVPVDLLEYLRWTRAHALAHKAQYEAGGATVQPLVLLMGNEAGDLDSAASAIALSYVMNHEQAYFMRTYGVPAGVYVPVLQTVRRALSQRQENLYVYEHVQVPVDALLCVDELGDTSSPAWGPGAQVALGLVDHPRLRVAWGTDRHVVVVVDHHEDEGLYQDAPLRIIRPPSTSPVGSAASLVAALAQQARHGAPLDARLADLLLSAIVLDTRNVGISY